MDQLRSDTLVMTGNEGITDTAVVVDGVNIKFSGFGSAGME